MASYFIWGILILTKRALLLEHKQFDNNENTCGESGINQSPWIIVKINIRNVGNLSMRQQPNNIT